MNDIFDLTSRPDPDVFIKCPESEESCLADFVSDRPRDFPDAELVILGFENQDETARGFYSDDIRREFYKLSHFGISRKIFDLGNFVFRQNAEKALLDFSGLIESVLQDNKRLILIGGKNEISYATGAAMAGIYEKDRWLAINVDSHLDVRNGDKKNGATVFRKLLEDRLIVPGYFYEIAFQPYFCSPSLFRFMKNQGVKLVSLEQIRSRETADLELRELIRQEFIHHSSSMSILFNFSLNALRASDAPGVNASSPFGLRAGEFLTLVQFAAKLVNTKIVQFSEYNPKTDIERRTAKLTAIALHRFCSSIAKI